MPVRCRLNTTEEAAVACCRAVRPRLPRGESGRLNRGLPLPISGITVPDMGKTGVYKVSEAAAIYSVATLSDALFTRTQQRVLGCLFGQPGRSFSVNELIHTTRAGSGAVQRELARLAGSGLVAIEHVGNQKRYRANPDSPVHDELVSIVRKTLDLTPQRPLFLADPAGAAHDPETP